MHYTLKQLRYFVEVGENGSVTQAAQRLNVSQPSVSAALVAMEEQFRVQLFVRHHARGLTLTPSGRRLLGEAKQLLRHADQFSHFAAGQGALLGGKVTVGCMANVAPIVMPKLLTSFNEVHPSVDIELHEIPIEDIFEALAEGRIEVALTYGFHLERRMDFRVISDLPPYALVAADHPLADREGISLAELRTDPIVALDLEYSRHYFQSIYEQMEMSPRTRLRVTSTHMARSLVAAGYGYCILNLRPMGDVALGGGQYRALRLTDSLPSVQFGVAVIPEIRITAAAGVFADHCATYWQESGFPYSIEAGGECCAAAK